MVFFRKIFVLQLVGLVLTYNFTDCDFEKIRKKYQEVIYHALDKYMNGRKSTGFNNHIYCEDPPDCLTKIDRITFYPNHGCTSLAKEIFAVRTNATLILQCPGYSGMQMNNTQAKTKRKKREATSNKCREQVSRLMELWRRFSRIS